METDEITPISVAGERKGKESPRRIKSLSPNRGEMLVLTNNPGSALPTLGNPKNSRGTSAFLSVDREGHRPPLSPISPRRVRKEGKPDVFSFTRNDQNDESDKMCREEDSPTASYTISSSLAGNTNNIVLPPIQRSAPDKIDEATYPSKEREPETTHECDVRTKLPPTSSIFQQALFDLNTRRKSSPSDPGDLMVRRSSLTSALINMGTIPKLNSLLEPIKKGRQSIQADVILEDEQEKATDVDGDLPPSSSDVVQNTSMKILAKTTVACRRFRRFRRKPESDKDVDTRAHSSEVDMLKGKQEAISGNDMVTSCTHVKAGLSTGDKLDKISSVQQKSSTNNYSDDKSKSPASVGILTPGEAQLKPLTYWRRAKSGISLKTVGQVTR